MIPEFDCSLMARDTRQRQPVGRRQPDRVLIRQLIRRLKKWTTKQFAATPAWPLSPNPADPNKLSGHRGEPYSFTTAGKPSPDQQKEIYAIEERAARHRSF